MNDQQHTLNFITYSNWVLFFIAGLIGLFVFPPKFTLGIVLGGLIVTVNFHMMARTLRKSLMQPNLSAHSSVLVKYYIRFILSGFIIFMLISLHIVEPLGLVLGLSIVVASIFAVTINELTKLIFKEAV